MKRCFSYTDARMYSTLDEEVKRMEYQGGFKKKLKTLMFREDYDWEAKIVNIDFRV